jgi:hypothetical protein
VEKQTTKTAKTVQLMYKGNNNKAILSKCTGQAQNENKHTFNVRHNGDRTWQNQGLPAQNQDNATCNTSL